MPFPILNIFALEVPHAKSRHISALRSAVLIPLDDRIDQRLCPLINKMFHFTFLIGGFRLLQLSIILDFR